MMIILIIDVFGFNQAVQIQLLRLVQSFCIGNTDSLHHLLTRSEYVEYCDIAAAISPFTLQNCSRGGLITATAYEIDISQFFEWLYYIKAEQYAGQSLTFSDFLDSATARADWNLMCKGSRGLITKMIGSLREAGDHSTLRQDTHP